MQQRLWHAPVRGLRRRAVLAGGLVLGLGLGGIDARADEGRLYTPGSFDRIEIDGSGQVRLVQGDREEVFVGGDARMQEGVQVDRSGSHLHVSLPGAWKFWDNGKAQVEIRVRRLSRITMSGATDLFAPGTIRTSQLGIDIAGAGLTRFDDLHAEKLGLTISGSGEAQLAGRVDDMHLSVSGRGKVTANQLQAASAGVSISGVGNADVWVTDLLRVDISGAGHVTYAGQPKIRQSISGLGSVEASGERR